MLVTKDVAPTAMSTGSAILWRIIGPALLFSGAAVGTSHLVQSTRAGAVYGLALAGVILVTCVLKYPAFRFGVDYGHANRTSIVAGYRELGLWGPILFALVTIPVLPIIIAAGCSAVAWSGRDVQSVQPSCFPWGLPEHGGDR
jgi:Mn2+/Fe2+ NRAMP family transporter